MSASNLTSAGQFASLGLISAASSYFEMAVTQFVINLRYCLMSCALSQKLSESTAFFHRFIMAAGIPFLTPFLKLIKLVSITLYKNPPINNFIRIYVRSYLVQNPKQN